MCRLGVLDDQQKRDFFAGLDVFALPSRSDSFGLVLLEAWANGLPNVAYRAGGPADIIRHDIDGLLARCGDVDDLTERGSDLFRAACARDLEGIVGKWRDGRYETDGVSTSWIKIKNPRYSQAEGREELFERA